jgi:hypothetical protein
MCSPASSIFGPQIHSFTGQLGQGVVKGIHAHSNRARSGSGDDLAAFELLRQEAGLMLRRLRPDNFAAFSELFTAAVLQVGAGGRAERAVREHCEWRSPLGAARYSCPCIRQSICPHCLVPKMHALLVAGPDGWW